MSKTTKIGMMPPHPGAFIRDEILEELNLSIYEAAEALGVRRATLSDLVNGAPRCLPRWRSGSRRLSASIWTGCFACKLGTTQRRCGAGLGRLTLNVITRSHVKALEIFQ